MNTGPLEESYMSDYNSLYLIETTYNSDRDATEVVFGYLEKEKDVEGRNMKVRVIVNVLGGKGDTAAVIEEGLNKARTVLKSASKAPYNED